MAIVKVWIIEGCISCGLCSDICPEVFVLDGEAKVIEGVNYSEYEVQIKESADSCPVEVIKFSE
jgi:ferredoxin